MHGEVHFRDSVDALAISASEILVATSHDGQVACFNVSNRRWSKVWETSLRDSAIPRAVTFDTTGSCVSIFALQTGEQ